MTETIEEPAADIPALFRAQWHDLVRLATPMVSDRNTAEDVVQDVFLRLHVRQRQVPGGSKAAAYARSAVLNGCRSVLRRRAIDRRLGLAGGGDAGAWDGGAPAGGWEPALLTPAAREAGCSAEQEAIRAEERQEVRSALAGLPRRARQVLVLRYYLCLTESEIAAALEITPGTVKSTAARGLAALAQALRHGRGVSGSAL